MSSSLSNKLIPHTTLNSIARCLQGIYAAEASTLSLYYITLSKDEEDASGNFPISKCIQFDQPAGWQVGVARGCLNATLATHENNWQLIISVNLHVLAVASPAGKHVPRRLFPPPLAMVPLPLFCSSIYGRRILTKLLFGFLRYKSRSQDRNRLRSSFDLVVCG